MGKSHTGIETAVSTPPTNSISPKSKAIERLRCKKLTGFSIKSFLQI